MDRSPDSELERRSLSRSRSNPEISRTSSQISRTYPEISRATQIISRNGRKQKYFIKQFHRIHLDIKRNIFTQKLFVNVFFYKYFKTNYVRMTQDMMPFLNKYFFSENNTIFITTFLLNI